MLDTYEAYPLLYAVATRLVERAVTFDIVIYIFRRDMSKPNLCRYGKYYATLCGGNSHARYHFVHTPR